MDCRSVEDLPTLDLDRVAVEPFAEFDRVRAMGPLCRSERGVEVLSYRLMDELFRDSRLRTYSSADVVSHGGTPLIENFVADGIFLMMPTERHRRIRRVFARPFAVRLVRDRRPMFDEVGGRIIADLQADGRCDMVAGFTRRFSAEVLCRVLGVPTDDLSEFADSALELRRIMHRPLDEHVEILEASLRHLREYAEHFLQDRRRHPQDDFISDLISAESEEGALQPDELIWGVVNLLLAGIDTTTYQMASALKAFVEHGAWERLGREPEMIPAAVSEAQRMAPVTTHLPRFTNEEMVVADVALPADQILSMNFLAAGRDPERFDRPHEFNIDRSLPIFPLGFGGGAHRCIGEALAFQEMVVATELLTSALQNVQLDGPVPGHSWTETFHGPLALPVTFEPRAEHEHV